MKRLALTLLINIVIFATNPAFAILEDEREDSRHAFAQKVVQAKGLEFWTETFGRRENPAILLIMGSGTQGLLWHQKFCEKLADKGFFVIRYDNRDVGLSSLIDYNKNPYDLMDMAKDAVAILDDYGIQKAHVVGASMGGMIATLLGGNFPERTASLTLMVTTPDVRSNLAAIQGKESTSPLSSPKPVFLTWVKSYLTTPPKTLEDQLERNLEGMRLLNGSTFPFDEALYRQLTLQGFQRTRSLENSFHHVKAMETSHALQAKAFNKIKAPTMILQGDEDPIFALDHGEALKKAIPHAQLEVIPGMGHVLNTHLYDTLIEKIQGVAEKRAP
jgi:pimeloyl-ACP methyl ester carboxylesterase